MAEPTDAPATEGAPVPYYEVKDGRVFIEGTDVTDMVRPPESEDEPEGDATPQKPPEPAVEGEGEEPEKEEPEPEKKEEAKEEAPPEKEESEEPEEPEKWKFKLKFRGNEEEVEWAHDDVQQRLTKLRAFEENEKEFWEKRREVDPYLHIVKSDWFKEKLKEGYESGELEKPVGPPPPPPRVQAELIRRRAEPDYDEVVSALLTYALEMGPEYAKLVDSDAETFLSEYDRVARDKREKRAAAEKKEPVDPKKPTPEELRKELAKKEAAKARATVAKPGTSSEPVSELKRWESRRRELERALRDPAQGHRQLDLTAEYLMHMDVKPTK